MKNVISRPQMCKYKTSITPVTPIIPSVIPITPSNKDLPRLDSAPIGGNISEAANPKNLPGAYSNVPKNTSVDTPCSAQIYPTKYIRL